MTTRLSDTSILSLKETSNHVAHFSHLWGAWRLTSDIASAGASASSYVAKSHSPPFVWKSAFSPHFGQGTRIVSNRPIVQSLILPTEAACGCSAYSPRTRWEESSYWSLPG